MTPDGLRAMAHAGVEKLGIPPNRRYGSHVTLMVSLIWPTSTSFFT